MNQTTGNQPRKRLEAAERIECRPAASAVDNPLRKESSNDIISA